MEHPIWDFPSIGSAMWQADTDGKVNLDQGTETVWCQVPVLLDIVWSQQLKVIPSVKRMSPQIASWLKYSSAYCTGWMIPHMSQHSNRLSLLQDGSLLKPKHDPSVTVMYVNCIVYLNVIWVQLVVLYVWRNIVAYPSVTVTYVNWGKRGTHMHTMWRGPRSHVHDMKYRD